MPTLLFIKSWLGGSLLTNFLAQLDDWCCWKEIAIGKSHWEPHFGCQGFRRHQNTSRGRTIIVGQWRFMKLTYHHHPTAQRCGPALEDNCVQNAISKATPRFRELKVSLLWILAGSHFLSFNPISPLLFWIATNEEKRLTMHFTNLGLLFLLLLTILQCLASVFGRSHRGSVPIDATGLTTNAARMRVGLPPLKPKNLHIPTRVGGEIKQNTFFQPNFWPVLKHERRIHRRLRMSIYLVSLEVR